MQLNSTDDCLKLECDLNRFVELFERLGLPLNIAKGFDVH